MLEAVFAAVTFSELAEQEVCIFLGASVVRVFSRFYLPISSE